MSLQRLYADGNQIKTSDGQRYRGIGYADFGQLLRLGLPNGEHALVRPLFQQRLDLARAAGWKWPLIARVFRHAGPWNAFGITDPWSYPMARAKQLMEIAAEYDTYIDWTGGDFQVCFPSSDPRWGNPNGPKGINEHNNRFCAEIADMPNGIWNTGNELFHDGKNGLLASMVKPPPWAPPLRYSGDYEDHRDRTHDLNCVNLHTDRGEESGAQKWVGKAHESAPFMWRENKPVIYDEPMGADEVARPGKRSNVPHYFFVLGTVLAMVDLVYFHSEAGRDSNGFGPIQSECWQAFCRGAAGVREKLGP